MNKKRKVKMKAFCKLTATVILNEKDELQDIEEIIEIDDILGDEEIIDIIY